MHTKQGYVGIGVSIAMLIGLAVVPVFAQTDDYGTGTTSGSYCPQLFQTVVRGSSGNQVLELQKFLSDYYDILPSTIQTGYFGRITQGYVMQFQKEQGLPSYGIAGSMTRAAIAKVCGQVRAPVVQTCPQITPPQCTNGTLVSNGTDANGCSLGYSCKQTSTPPPTNSSLRASPSSGQAPLTISLQAPQDVMSKMQKCVYSIGWFGASGNGLYVDWGDGRTDPQYSQSLSGQSCAPVVQSHTYTAPGTYTIKVGSWHPGPTDAPVTDWSGTTLVTVTGASQSRSLNLTYPVGGETFSYEEFPRVKWDLVADKRYDILIELVANNGVVVGSNTVAGLAYSGSGSGDTRPRSFDAYNAQLSSGNTQFFVRLSLLDNGSAVLIRKSGTFTMSGNYTGYMGTGASPLAGTAPLTVTYNQMVGEQVCLSYSLDWGDGTAPTVVRGPLLNAAGDNCQAVHPAQKKLSFTHVYTSPGTFTITWKSNDDYPSLSLEESRNIPNTQTVYVGQ